MTRNRTDTMTRDLVPTHDAEPQVERHPNLRARQRYQEDPAVRAAQIRMSLDWYYRNREQVNARRRAERVAKRDGEAK